MKMFNYFFAVATVVMLVSCSENSDIDGNGSTDGLESPKITILMSADGSASSDDQSRGTVGSDWSFKWTPGDKLGVMNSLNNNVAFELQGSAEVAVGDFKGDLNPLLVDETLYVVYPHSELEGQGFNTDGSYTFTLPNKQVHTYDTDGKLDNKSLANYTFLVGKSTKEIGTTAVTTLGVAMKQVMYVLPMNINLVNIPEGTFVKSVVLNANKPIFAKSATVAHDESGSFTVTPKNYNLSSRIEAEIVGNEFITNETLPIKIAMFPFNETLPIEWYVELVLDYTGVAYSDYSPSLYRQKISAPSLNFGSGSYLAQTLDITPIASGNEEIYVRTDTGQGENQQGAVPLYRSGPSDKYQYEGWVELQGNLRFKVAVEKNGWNYGANWDYGTNGLPLIPIGQEVQIVNNGGSDMHYDTTAGLHYILFNDWGTVRDVKAVKYEYLDLVGDATADGWDVGTALTKDEGSYVWTATNIAMKEGGLKIRFNGKWNMALGGDVLDNIYSGYDGNIPFKGETGDYNIRLDMTRPPYSITFTPISIQ